MIALVINNFALEIPDQMIPLNFRGTDAKDLAELFVSFSNSFLIPHTDLNDNVLENAHQIFSDSTLPYKRIECNMLFYGRDLFGRSTLVLLESDSEEGWRSSFYAGTSGVTLAGSIRSLDLGTMEYTISGITTKVLNEYPQLVNTSPLDHGFMKRLIDDEIDWNLARPSVYIASVLLNMLTAGRIALNIKAVAEVAKRIVIPLQDLKKIDSQHLGYSFKSDRITSAQTLTNGGINLICVFNNVLNGNESAGYDNTDGIFRIAHSCKATVKATVKLNVTSGAGNNRILYIMHNENNELARVEFTPPDLGTHSISLSVDDALLLSKVLVGPEAGFVTLHIGYTRTSGAGANDTLAVGSEFSVEISDEAVASNTIDVAKSLPEMTKADLIKEFLMFFNGIVYYKDASLNITGFGNLTEMDAQDWSQKVDTQSRKIVITSGSPLGKETQFKYENNEDVSTVFGGAKVAINNDNIADLITYHTSKFAASKDTVLLGLDVMRIPLWESTLTTGPGDATHSGGGANFNITLSEWPDIGELGDYIYIPAIGRDFLILSTTPGSPGTIAVAGPTAIPNFSNVTYEVYKLKKARLNPRLGLVSTGDASSSINYRLNNDDDVVTDFKEITFEPLKWKALLTTYYRLWLGSMERYKLVRLFVLLDESDVMEFDTTKCIFIEGQGQFYCELLNKFVGDGEPTEAELIALKSPIDSSKITDL